MYGKWRYGIRNLCTGWWQVVIHWRPGNSFRHALHRRMSGHESRSDRFWGKSLVPAGNRAPITRSSSPSPIKPSEFPRFLSNLSFTTNSPVLSLGLTTKRQRRSEGKIPRISDLSVGPRRSVCFALWSLQAQGKRSRFLFHRELRNTKSAFKILWRKKKCPMTQRENQIPTFIL